MNASAVFMSVSEALDRVDRRDFIASPDLHQVISGHSIPSRAAAKQILMQVGPIEQRHRVLIIGAGSGYLPALFAHLASHVEALEREPSIARIAVNNLAKVGLERVKVHVGCGEDGWPNNTRFDRIVCCCVVQGQAPLFDALEPGGTLYCLEGTNRDQLQLVRYWLDGPKQQRQALGIVDFGRSTGQILIDLGFVTPDLINQAKSEAHKRKQPVLNVLRAQLGIDDAEFYRTLAGQHGVEFVTADEVIKRLDFELFKRFSRTFLDNQRLLPIRLDGDNLVVVTDNPDLSADDVVLMQVGGQVSRALVTPTDFRRIWSALELTDRSQKVLSWSDAPSDSVSSDDLLDPSQHEISHYLVSIYEAMLLDAVSANASDIHLERYGKRIRIRIRTDGELHDLSHYKLTPRDHAGLINVIKVRAEINIAERRLPQGGRSRMRVGATNYDLRVQIQPSLHGEHAVIRLLSQTGRVMGLDELGMVPAIAEHVQRLLENPSGLLLVVGPTGSGKSTTLYAGLQALADDGRRKVITVEDPIEYSIDNIQQTRARPDIGFSFADAMRSFVRQDPDVILVGEIRDRVTALEAIRASQTGHLVLSTLHSNDSVDALQRLYDLDALPNSIASELLAVIAQRLAKRICEHCRKPAEPDRRILRELFPEQVPDGFRCFEGGGCSHCSGRGTRGRIAVVEFLQVDDNLRDLISSQPPTGELRWRALDSGLMTMRDSALDHVIEGRIPMSELPRLLPRDRMAPELRGGRRVRL